MKTSLYIIRHGKTQASLDLIYCGATDLPLCSEGIAEIKSFKDDGLYPDNVQAYYSSGMKRAVETLKLIFGDVNYKAVAELSEMNFGEFEMHSHDELIENASYISWISDDSGNTKCAKGEANNEFYARVERGIEIFFEDLRKNKYESAALTAHGGSIGYFARTYLGNELSFYDSMPSQGRGYHVEADVDENGVEIISWERI